MFSKIADDIYPLFDSTEWVSKGVLTYPGGFSDKISRDEYVMVHVLPSNTGLASYGANPYTSGLIILPIFTPNGRGNKRLFQISDFLGGLLNAKQFKNGTQTTIGALQSIGPDTVNKALLRGDFTIPFKFFGD